MGPRHTASFLLLARESIHLCLWVQVGVFSRPGGQRRFCVSDDGFGKVAFFEGSVRAHCLEVMHGTEAYSQLFAFSKKREAVGISLIRVWSDSLLTAGTV